MCVLDCYILKKMLMETIIKTEVVVVIYIRKISLFIFKIRCIYCINVLITVSKLRIKLIVLD